MLTSQSWAIRRVAQAEVAVIFGSAYGKAATAAPANSAFRSTGIWTVNRYVLQDHHFFPSVALLLLFTVFNISFINLCVAFSVEEFL